MQVGGEAGTGGEEGRQRWLKEEARDARRCTCLLHTYPLAVLRAKMLLSIPRAKIIKSNANSVFL